MEFLDNLQNNLSALSALGITLPSPMFLLWATVFNIIGFIGLRRGVRNKQPLLRVIGLILLLYPLVVTDFWIMIAVGVAGTALVFFYKKAPAGE